MAIPSLRPGSACSRATSATPFYAPLGARDQAWARNMLSSILTTDYHSSPTYSWNIPILVNGLQKNVTNSLSFLLGEINSRWLWRLRSLYNYFQSSGDQGKPVFSASLSSEESPWCESLHSTHNGAEMATSPLFHLLSHSDTQCIQWYPTTLRRVRSDG